MAKKYQLKADGRVWCEGDALVVCMERVKLEGYFTKLQIVEK